MPRLHSVQVQDARCRAGILADLPDIAQQLQQTMTFAVERGRISALFPLHPDPKLSSWPAKPNLPSELWQGEQLIPVTRHHLTLARTTSGLLPTASLPARGAALSGACWTRCRTRVPVISASWWLAIYRWACAALQHHAVAGQQQRNDQRHLSLCKVPPRTPAAAGPAYDSCCAVTKHGCNLKNHQY